MQPRTRILTIALAVLIASVVMSACYGGDSGRVWFNLPSAKLHIQPDGTAKVFGFNVGPVVPGPMLQQMTTAGVQQAEARIGYNGIHVFMNGEELPYVKWDAQSAAGLQGLLGSGQIPGVPPAVTQYAQYLPWLRKIGLGAKLLLPGDAPSGVARWSGETDVTPEAAPEKPITLNVGGIAFDDAGKLVVAGLDSTALAAAAGGALPSLPTDALAMLKSLGIASVNVKTDPNGLNLSTDGGSLPSVAYDSKSLAALAKYLPAFAGDPATVGMVNQIVPMLPNLALNADVSFTGEPIGMLELPQVDVKIGEDGSLSALGLPVGQTGTIDANTLAMLQKAGIQNLNLDVGVDGLYAAVNGKKLPNIAWNDASIGALAGIAGAAAGQSPEAMSGILNLVRGSGVKANVVLPGGSEQSAAVDYTMQPAVLGDLTAPTIHLDAVFDKSGALQEISNLSSTDLAGLGVSLAGVTLPPQLLELMNSSNAGTMTISTEANKLNVALDGQMALSVDYDADSLSTLLDLVTNMTSNSPLSDPALRQLIDTVILPVAPGADVQINVTLQ